MDIKKIKHYWVEILFSIVGIALVIRLFRLSVPTASDFEVYWYAVHAWVDGKSPYQLYSPVYNGLVFKYPPWILSFFLPFAWISMETSKWIWTLLQVIAIAYSAWWLILRGINRRIVFLVTLIFWWMWLAHAYFGQIMVFLMAFALWCCEKISPELKPNPASAKRTASLGILFSSKIFSLISLVGAWRNLLYFRTWIYTALGLLLGHILLVVTYPLSKLEFSPSRIFEIILSLYKEWIHAATSGGADLGEKIVRGQQNHGLTAAILRNFHIEATHVHADIGVALVLAVSLSGLWMRVSRKLSWEEKWSGWLALGTIAHPLAWHHSFTMAFPLCTFAIDRAIRCRRPLLIGLAFLGTSAICLFIPQVIGVDAVIPLEWVGSKSWGVILCAWVLTQARKQAN